MLNHRLYIVTFYGINYNSYKIKLVTLAKPNYPEDFSLIPKQD